jgi:hypothetical protein
MANYTYSMDLSSYFADKVIEEAKPDTGIMQRNKSKAEATEKPKDDYDPYGFMPNFAKALAVSYPNEDMGKKALGVAVPKLDTGVQSAFIQMYLDGLAPPVASQAPEQPVAPPGGITNLEKPSLTMGTGMDAYAPPSELSDTPDAGDAFTESLFAAMEETAPERKAAGGEGEAPKVRGLMAKSDRKMADRLANTDAEDAFYMNIGIHGESDHGSTPQVTNDAREANKPDSQKSRDIGFGHKITASESASGKIHGITFKKEDGTFRPLTEDDKRHILKQDMALHQDEARRAGWDKKLANLGTSWEELEGPYQNALTSLAYNVGGGKAGRTWTNVLTAAKNKDVSAFAAGLRRKDAGRNTEGMDNRVAKELYYAGLIDSLADVKAQLPLATSRSGVPLTKE